MGSFRENITAFCASHGLRLNTDLGQHYLVDEEVLSAIVQTANLQKGETVVEIGAGIGILTKELLDAGATVDTIELDARVLPLLRTYVEASRRGNQLRIIEGNALDVPFPAIPYKVVANIPYHITSPLLRHAFLESPQSPISMTLLIQREVAERICETHDRGLLTIVVSLFGNARIVRHVPPFCFLPPPKVDSSVLHIDCFEKPLADGEVMDRLLKLLKLGFGQKRKMLRNTLGSLPGGAERLQATGIDLTRRPQTLTTAEWLGLAAHPW